MQTLSHFYNEMRFMLLLLCFLIAGCKDEQKEGKTSDAVKERKTAIIYLNSGAVLNRVFEEYLPEPDSSSPITIQDYRLDSLAKKMKLDSVIATCYEPLFFKTLTDSLCYLNIILKKYQMFQTTPDKQTICVVLKNQDDHWKITDTLNYRYSWLGFGMPEKAQNFGKYSVVRVPGWEGESKYGIYFTIVDGQFVRESDMMLLTYRNASIGGRDAITQRLNLNYIDTLSALKYTNYEKWESGDNRLYNYTDISTTNQQKRKVRVPLILYLL